MAVAGSVDVAIAAVDRRFHATIRGRHAVTIDAPLVERVRSRDPREFIACACLRLRVAERACRGLCFHVSVMAGDAPDAAVPRMFKMAQGHIPDA